MSDVYLHFGDISCNLLRCRPVNFIYLTLPRLTRRCGALPQALAILGHLSGFVEAGRRTYLKWELHQLPVRTLAPSENDVFGRSRTNLNWNVVLLWHSSW